MITHFSKTTPQPPERDVIREFPQTGIDAKLFVENEPAEVVISPTGSTWEFKYGLIAISGTMGERIVHSDVKIETWSRDSAKSVAEALGLSNRELLKFPFSAKEIDRFCCELDRIRSAASGEGPFPLDLYRANETFGGSMSTPDFMEEIDALNRAGLNPQDPLLFRAQFLKNRSELIILGSGNIFGHGAISISEGGLFWDNLKFPQRDTEVGIENIKLPHCEETQRKKVA